MVNLQLLSLFYILCSLVPILGSTHLSEQQKRVIQSKINELKKSGTSLTENEQAFLMIRRAEANLKIPTTDKTNVRKTIQQITEKFGNSDTLARTIMQKRNFNLSDMNPPKLQRSSRSRPFKVNRIDNSKKKKNGNNKNKSSNNKQDNSQVNEFSKIFLDAMNQMNDTNEESMKNFQEKAHDYIKKGNENLAQSTQKMQEAYNQMQEQENRTDELIQEFNNNQKIHEKKMAENQALFDQQISQTGFGSSSTPNQSNENDNSTVDEEINHLRNNIEKELNDTGLGSQDQSSSNNLNAVTKSVAELRHENAELLQHLSQQLDEVEKLKKAKKESDDKVVDLMNQNSRQQENHSRNNNNEDEVSSRRAENQPLPRRVSGVVEEGGDSSSDEDELNRLKRSNRTLKGRLNSLTATLKQEEERIKREADEKGERLRKEKELLQAKNDRLSNILFTIVLTAVITLLIKVGLKIKHASGNPFQKKQITTIVDRKKVSEEREKEVKK